MFNVNPPINNLLNPMNPLANLQPLNMRGLIGQNPPVDDGAESESEDLTQDEELDEIDQLLLKLYPKLKKMDWNQVGEVNPSDTKGIKQETLLPIDKNDLKTTNKLESLLGNKGRREVTNFESVLNNQFEKFKITQELRTAFADSQEKKNIKLQDVFHTFKKGHKLQIQVQSTWFPLIDLNPQTYVDNIYKADEKDFKTQTHTVFTDSKIEFSVLK